MEVKKIEKALEKTIVSTFETLFSEKPCLSDIRQVEKAAEDVVVASIGLTGHMNCSLVIVSPLSSMRFLVSKMLGMDLGPESLQDIVDGTGEILNIFAWSMKSLLKDSVGNFELSLPAVIVGMKDTEIARMKKTQKVALSAKLGQAKFETYLFYSEQNEYSIDGIGALASEQGAEAAAAMLKKMYQARERK